MFESIKKNQIIAYVLLAISIGLLAIIVEYYISVYDRNLHNQELVIIEFILFFGFAIMFWVTGLHFLNKHDKDK